MVQLRDDIVGLDAAILSPPAVWEASGHLQNFTDPLVDCRNCNERFRLDKLDDPHTCPNCGAEGLVHRAAPVQPDVQDLSPGRSRSPRRRCYLRPETAQGMFVNFNNVLHDEPQEAAVRHRADRQVVPQRDHAGQLRVPHARVRADGDGVLRAARRGGAVVRVLVQERYRWYVDLGIPESKLRLRAHDADELSHYSSGTSDVEFLFPWGWDELEGIANRGDYDLTQHAKASGEKLDYFDQATGERYVPHVIEPAAGATRTMMAFLLAAYDEEEVRGETRTVLRLHPRLAPYKVAVLPLVEEREALAARAATCSTGCNRM